MEGIRNMPGISVSQRPINSACGLSRTDWMNVKMLRCLVCLCVIASLAGCASDQVPTWPTTGKVVFADGSPVRTGTIELESQAHELSASGRIEEDGTFVLGTYDLDDGAVAGDHAVIVVQFILNDGTVDHTRDHGRKVPPIFASYESSGLTTTVAEGQPNELTITLPDRK